MGVLTCVSDDAIGVEDGHDSEGARRRLGVLGEPVRDRGSGPLVAVDAADNEHRSRGVGIADDDSAIGRPWTE
jgi:hypothetical protein